MTTKDIPHGHGLSYKKGIVDGLLNGKKDELEKPIPNGHDASYNRGVKEGKQLANEINSRVRD